MLVGIALSAQAEPPAHSAAAIYAQSMDLMSSGSPNKAARANGATSEDTVGDPDSFARAKTYLGVAQTELIQLLPDCTGFPSEQGKCIELDPAPGFTFVNEEGLASIVLPKHATNSLVCFTVTPITGWNWQNDTAITQTAQMSLNTTIQVESPVLDGLSDPLGNPFNGQLFPVPASLSTLFEARSLAPGEFHFKSPRATRSCIAGIVTTRSLRDVYGLTDTQIREFFQNPITFTFGVRGGVAMATDAFYVSGVRLYGD
jgi:hypothetical protein